MKLIILSGIPLVDKLLQKHDELIYAEFPDGWYSLTELKEKLQGIYDSIGLRRIAKATDIGKYYTYTKKQKSIGGTRFNGFEIHRAKRLNN